MPIRDHIRMPPDGAGKRFYVDHTLRVSYIAASTSDPFTVGSDVVGQASGTQGVVNLHRQTGLTTGFVIIKLKAGFEEDDFVIGETLTVNSTATIQVEGQVSLYANRTQIVSGDNPYHSQRVDAEGAAYTRFSEGAVNFEAFGAIQVNDSTSIGSYVPSYDGLPYLFSDIPMGNATGEYDSDTGSYTLRCTTAAGDSITRRSNKYHQYHPGVGQYIKMTVACGDAGKDNVVRSWGYYDDNDGVFFCLHEHTLELHLRKNMGSGVEETVIPQSQWNVDKLDGSGLSQVVIDPSKNNIWWFDLAYLGAGRVRCGVYGPGGERITAHVFENSNTNDYSFMRTATLPVGYEQRNLGLAGSTSEFHCNLSVVTQAQRIKPVHTFFGREFASKTITGVTNTHLASVRAAGQFKGRDNHVTILPFDMDFYAFDSSTGEPKAFKILVAFNPTLTNPVWEAHTDPRSSAEFTYNSDDTNDSPLVMYTAIVHPVRTLDLSGIFPYDGNLFISRWHNASRPHGSLFAAPLNPADSIDVFFDFTWREYP